VEVFPFRKEKRSENVRGGVAVQQRRGTGKRAPPCGCYSAHVYGDPKLAPPDEMVRYLATFRRFLDSVVAHSERHDLPGLLLDGYLADALHNLPAMLWHYDETSWHAPSQMRTWLERDFLEWLRQWAPPELVEHAGRVLAAAGAPEVLGLPGGPEQLRLPPLESLGACLDVLHTACVTIRSLRNLAGNWSREGGPWANLKHVTAAEEKRATAMGELARVLLPVPAAIVSWPTFDRAAFGREVRAPRVPASWREWLDCFLTES
jgi:hypothetical protein